MRIRDPNAVFQKMPCEQVVNFTPSQISTFTASAKPFFDKRLQACGKPVPPSAPTNQPSAPTNSPAPSPGPSYGGLGIYGLIGVIAGSICIIGFGLGLVWYFFIRKTAFGVHEYSPVIQ